MNVNDNINLNEIFYIVKKKWFILSSIYIVLIILSVIYTNQLTDLYKSEITIIKNYQNTNSLVQQSVPSLFNFSGALDNSAIEAEYAFELLKSEDFISALLINANLMNYFGFNKLNEKDISFEPGKKISFNNLNDQDISNINFATSALMRNLEISNIRNFTKISYYHPDPIGAEIILKELIDYLNIEMGKKKINKHELAIQYYKLQISKNPEGYLKNSLYNLIQKEQEQLMLANVDNDYLFLTVRPSRATNTIFYPNKILIFFMTFMFASLINILIVFFSKKTINLDT